MSHTQALEILNSLGDQVRHPIGYAMVTLLTTMTQISSLDGNLDPVIVRLDVTMKDGRTEIKHQFAQGTKLFLSIAEQDRHGWIYIVFGRNVDGGSHMASSTPNRYKGKKMELMLKHIYEFLTLNRTPHPDEYF